MHNANVSEDVHRTLEARAAQHGMALSDFLLADVAEVTRLPTLEEHVARVRGRPMLRMDVSARAPSRWTMALKIAWCSGTDFAGRPGICVVSRPIRWM